MVTGTSKRPTRQLKDELADVAMVPRVCCFNSCVVVVLVVVMFVVVIIVIVCSAAFSSIGEVIVFWISCAVLQLVTIEVTWVVDLPADISPCVSIYLFSICLSACMSVCI